MWTHRIFRFTEKRNRVGYVVWPEMRVWRRSSETGKVISQGSRYDESGRKERGTHESRHAAESWNIERRIVTRLEYDARRNNPRFIVTNLDTPAKALYEDLYCQRGKAENRIKEASLDLFGTRVGFRYCFRHTISAENLFIHAYRLQSAPRVR